MLKVREYLEGSTSMSTVPAAFPSPNSRARPPILTRNERGKFTFRKWRLVQGHSRWEEESRGSVIPSVRLFGANMRFRFKRRARGVHKPSLSSYDPTHLSSSISHTLSHCIEALRMTGGPSGWQQDFSLWDSRGNSRFLGSIVSEL